MSPTTPSVGSCHAAIRVASGSSLLPMGNHSSSCCIRTYLTRIGRTPSTPSSVASCTGATTSGRASGSPQPTRGGNLILQTMFDRLHGSVDERRRIPPFFVFTKAGRGRDVRFRGLAVPGAPGITANEDLVAVWRTGASGQRFQNYRALFSILDVSIVSRAWIDDLLTGVRNGSNAPGPWSRWRSGRTAQLLTAPASLLSRSREQQLPDPADRPIISTILHHFQTPTDFEACAARIWEMQAGRIEYTMTRPSRDGGRDAFGTVRIGPKAIQCDSSSPSRPSAMRSRTPSVSVTLRASSRASVTGCSASWSRPPTSIRRHMRSTRQTAIRSS